MSAPVGGVLFDVLFLGAPLLLACASLATIRRGSGASGALSMRIGLAAVGVGTAFHHPAVRQAAIATVAAPLMSTAYHAAFLIVGICVLDVLAAGLGRSGQRRRVQLSIGVAALVLLALPWLVDPPGPHGTSTLYGPDFFNDGWQTAAHAAVLVSLLGWAEVSLLRHCLSRGLPIARTAVGVSLLLIAATAAFALVCLGTAAITSALWSIGLGSAVSADLYMAVTAGSMALATLFVAAGAAWVPLAGAWSSWRRARERKKRVDVLLPHWQGLSEVLADHSPFTPGIRETPRSAEQARLQELLQELLLFGEIREAHWRLYGLVAESEVEAFLNEADSLGVPVSDVRAYVDQRCLDLGLQRWRGGQRAVRGRRTKPTAPTTHQALVEHLLRGRQIQRRLTTAAGGEAMSAEGPVQADAPQEDAGCLTSDRLQHAQATYRALVQDHYPVEFSIGHRLAYLRTYASPRVAGLLVQTGHVAHTPLKRATDTGLFIYELIHAGFDSETGEHVLARLRQMHLRWKIRNEDYLWVLGTFVVLSLRLIDQVSFRPVSEVERQATVDWYRELGTRMGVKDIPADFATFAAAFDAYELANLRRSPAGQQLLAATWQAALSTMPVVLRPFTCQAIAALTNEPARTALGLDRPSALTTSAVHLALRTHSRTGVLSSTAPRFTPGGPQVVYPGGYRLEQLGPDVHEGPRQLPD